MNRNIEILYKIVKPRIDEFLFKSIVGETIANGIERYHKSQASLIHDYRIDYALILVEALDNSILSNKDFLKLFITQCILDNDVIYIAQKLAINSKLSTFNKRLEILKKSKGAQKKAIIEQFDLEKDYFNEPPAEKIISTENIIPFSPVPIQEKNAEEIIPKEYLSLHDYQKRVKDRLIQKLIFDKPNARMLVHMPTGSGKTKTAVEAIIDFIRIKLRIADGGGTVVWFAHSKELCDQAYSTFKSMWLFKGDFPIDVYKIFGDADYDVIRQCISKKVSFIFIGFQKYNSLLLATDQLSRKLKFFLHSETRLVIVDEAHKSLAPTYERAIDSVTQMPDCRLVGLTATPGRSNYVLGDDENQSLANYFGRETINITDNSGNYLADPLTYLQNQEFLAKIKFDILDFQFNFVQHGYTAQQLNDIAQKDDLGEEELNLIASDPHRNALIVEKIKDHYSIGESILVFACSIDHCIILQRILKSMNIETAVITGSTIKSFRSKAISDFKEGRIKIIINYGVLSTGFDAPKLNTLIIARPTKSIILYSQIVGRALRGPGNGGNLENTIITIRDNLIGFPDADFMFSYWDEFWN